MSLKQAISKKRLGVFDLLIAVLLAVFFIVGACSCGNFRSTGDSLLIRGSEETVAVFEVQSSTPVKAKSVRLNVGAIFTKVGDTAEITVRRSGVKNLTAVPNSSMGDRTVANVHSDKKGVTDSNFRWITFELENERDFAFVSVESDCDFILNELILFDANGNAVPLKVSKLWSKGYSDPETTLAAAIDAQDSFVESTSARYLFTEEEAHTLLAIENMRLGNSYFDGQVYHLDGRWNYIAAALYLPGVALFGGATGGLRITSLLFVTLGILGAYLLCRNLFKSARHAFWLSALLCVGGLTLSAATHGVAYAPVFALLIWSAALTYRFFSVGVSDKRPVRSALPVLFAGLCAALAISIDVFSIIPTLGVATVFAFGLRRQKRAHELVLERVEGTAEEIEEQTKKENAAYAYKQKITVSFAALSLVAGTLLFVLLGGVLGYYSAVRALDNPADPKMTLWQILLVGIRSACGENATQFSAANATIPLAFLLPLKSATLFESIGETAVAQKLAFINPVLSTAALCAFVFTTVALIQGYIHKETGRETARLRRGYFVLLGGAALSLLGVCFGGSVSVLSSLTALPFIFGFIPLACKTLEDGDWKAGKLIGKILLPTVCGVAFVWFILTVPAIIGISVPAGYAKLYSIVAILG